MQDIDIYNQDAIAIRTYNVHDCIEGLAGTVMRNVLDDEVFTKSVRAVIKTNVTKKSSGAKPIELVVHEEMEKVRKEEVRKKVVEAYETSLKYLDNPLY